MKAAQKLIVWHLPIIIFILLFFFFHSCNDVYATSVNLTTSGNRGIVTLTVNATFDIDESTGGTGGFLQLMSEDFSQVYTYNYSGTSEGSLTYQFDTTAVPADSSITFAAMARTFWNNELKITYLTITPQNLVEISVSSPSEMRGIHEISVTYSFPSSFASSSTGSPYAGSVSLKMDSTLIKRIPVMISYSGETTGTDNIKVDTTKFADGVHNLSAVALIDNRSNSTWNKFTQNITTDNTPKLTISPTGEIKGEVEFTVSYNFPTTESTSGSVWVQLNNGFYLGYKSIPLSDTSQTQGSCSFAFDSTEVPDGTYTIKANVGIYGRAWLRGLEEAAIVIVNTSDEEIVDPTKEVSKDAEDTTVGDPISVATGNMYMPTTDILIPAKEIPLELLRTYNSQDDFEGSFGYGWRSSYDITLEEQANESVIEIDEKEVYTIYTKNPDGSYTPSSGKYSNLTKNPDDSFTVVRKQGRKLFFNPMGRLIAIEGRNGNALEISYNLDSIISEVSDSSGRKLIFTANSQGKITEVNDPAGRIFKYEYDEQGNLIKMIDPLDNETCYLYDEEHNLIQQIDTNGHSVYFEYDALDRANHSWRDGNKNEVSLVFDPDNNTTASTDSLGNTTTFEYNDYGLPIRVTNAQNNIREFSWDDDLNKTSSTDEAGNTTYFSYDSRGNLLTITDALAHITTFTYESEYNMCISITDPLDNTTTYTYDGMGNIIEVKDALENATTNSYDREGNLISLTDARGNQTSYDYDVYGNLIKVTDALDSQTLFSYDILGNNIMITDAKANVTTFVYDDLNRLIKIIYADGSESVYTYDGVGNKTSITDPVGNITQYSYDQDNQLVQVTDAMENITSYIYDTEGNRIGITDAKENPTIYQYDNLNRLIKVISALVKEKSFTYDATGNRISLTDSNGNTIYYTYDVINQLTGTIYPDASMVNFQYDANGRRISMTDSTGIVQYSYDNLNRLIGVDSPGDDNIITCGYDAGGNRINMVNQDGGITTYEYDHLNRLSKLIDPASKETTYTYDEVSNLTQMKYPNNTIASYTFDNLKRLINLINQGEDEEIISSYVYDYDQAGMRTRVGLANGDYINYTYDALNRLTSEVKKKRLPSNRIYYSYQYEFDVTGNRTSLVRELHQKPVVAERGDDDQEENKRPSFWDLPGLTNFGYQYDAENRLLQVRADREDTSYIADYEYDNNGNMIKKTEYKENNPFKAEVTVYSYDYENRLIKITYPDGTTSEYVYDGVGKRVQAIEKGEGTHYLYDGLNVIIERDKDNNTIATYTRGLSYGGGIGGIISVTQAENDNSEAEQGWKTLYYHYDGIGAVTALTDEEGEVEQEYTYDAYGNLLSVNGSVSNPYQFSTKEYNPDSGLIYFGVRYYDPRLGRFITKDPLGMIDGPNVYLYCSNNPVNLIDPLGLCEEETDKENIELSKIQEAIDNLVKNTPHVGLPWDSILYFTDPSLGMPVCDDWRVLVYRELIAMDLKCWGIEQKRWVIHHFIVIRSKNNQMRVKMIDPFLFESRIIDYLLPF